MLQAARVLASGGAGTARRSEARSGRTDPASRTSVDEGEILRVAEHLEEDDRRHILPEKVMWAIAYLSPSTCMGDMTRILKTLLTRCRQ